MRLCSQDCFATLAMTDGFARAAVGPRNDGCLCLDEVKKKDGGGYFYSFYANSNPICSVATGSMQYGAAIISQ